MKSDDQMEPTAVRLMEEAKTISAMNDAVAISQAISLKRIADRLDMLAGFLMGDEADGEV